jgi:hypothetical protein
MTKRDSLKFPVQIILLLSLIYLPACKKDPGDATGFASTPVSKQVAPGLIDEASGIADSKANPGYLWIEQDGGNSNDIILLSYAAEVVKKINIRSAVNRDWEDMAISNGPAAGTNYIYIADIGDNNKVFSDYTIYRFPEPLASVDTVSVYDKISFQYPDGPHDAEAMIVDHSSKDIYIITKQDVVSRIYKLAYPQNAVAINTAIYTGSLSFTGVVSGAGSAAGDEWLLKTYTSLYYWKKAGNESIQQTLAKEPVTLSYQQESQGEALCFKNDNSGFYTLSERPSAVASVNLNFYKRVN